MTLVRCAAVLFDCDGVLVDSDASVLSAWSRWAHEHGLPADEVLAVVHGRRSADTVAALIDDPDREQARALIDRYEIEDARQVRAIAGAASLVASIPTGRWAVVTSATTGLATARLAAAGIVAPPVLITADDVAHGKPDPEGYAAAARRLGVAAAATVVLEDALAGIHAARAAGVGTVIGVGRGGLEDAADLVIADLSELRWTVDGLQI